MTGIVGRSVYAQGMAAQPYSADPQVRLAVARITGAAKNYAERRDSARDQALLRIGTAAQELNDNQLKEALAAAAAHFMLGECWYRDDALDLLAGARADLETAEEIAAMRRARQPLRIGDAEL